MTTSRPTTPCNPVDGTGAASLAPNGAKKLSHSVGLEDIEARSVAGGAQIVARGQ